MKSSAPTAPSKCSGAKHYVVLRSESGLKLYLATKRGFGINKDAALEFATRGEAETAAMNKSFTDPRFIGKLEVSVEEKGEEQDLKKYKLGDIIDAFGDIQVSVDAVPVQ